MKNETNEHLIAIDDFCISHKIEHSFIWSLHEAGLIHIETIETTGYVEDEELSDLEKFTRFFYEMNINIEGIETITHLLHQIQGMNQEVNRLKNRLRFYEGDR